MDGLTIYINLLISPIVSFVGISDRRVECSEQQLISELESSLRLRVDYSNQQSKLQACG